MKNKILFIAVCSLALMMSCIKQEYYDIPTYDGKVVIYDNSTATSSGISTLDDNFTVDVTFATAKPGDKMKVELLNLQVPQGGTVSQLLPMSGTQKEVTVGSDLKASVTYTRAEAKLNKVGDYITVIFSGETDYAKYRVDMKSATSVSKPKVGTKYVDVMRSDDIAFFNVTVAPVKFTYSGSVIVKRKNGNHDPWVDVGTGSFAIPANVPISGTDFAAGKDTMYYSFTVQQGSYTDQIDQVIIVREPYFFLKKTGTLTLGGSAAGMNILTKTSVAATNANAIIAIDGGSLIIHGGSAWAVGGKSIQFVPSTPALYDANKSADVINAFAAGSPVNQADPIAGTGIYIFKIVNGTLPKDIYYGMLKVTGVTPGVSVTFEYRIGNLYAHLSVIQ